MNREKKQQIVVAVLVVLVLSIGAFQFTRSDPPPPPSTAKEKPKSKDGEAAELQKKKYPELVDLQGKDPFEVATFVAGTKQPAPTPPTPTPVGGTQVSEPVKDKLKALPKDSNVWVPGGEIVPVAPPKPVFGYSLVGIVYGSHPMAVFQDEKGNQRLVEAGQEIGSEATIISISRGQVRVKFNAETLVLNVGGNTNGK